MKETLKKFLKNHRKPVISVIVLSSLVVGTLIYSNLDSIDNPVNVVTDTDTIDTQITKESEIKEETTSTVAEESTATENTSNEVAEAASVVESKPTVKPEVEDKNNTKPNNEDSNEKGTTEKQSEEPEATSTTITGTSVYLPWMEYGC